MGDTTIYFVVDAVDECDASVTQLLYDLGRLTKSNLNCRIILTSRAEERIISVLAQFSDKVIHLDKIMENEIRLYLAKQVENAAFADDKGLLLTLGTTMLRVKLLVELLALIRPDDRHLLDLSTLESYDDIYAQIIKHIMAPGSWLQEALFCVAFAERPLSIDELSIALGKHPSAANTTQLPPEAWEMLPQRTLADYSSTTLKLVIRIQDSTVYLIHDTLREFIRSQLQPLVRSTISTHPSSAPPPGSLLLLKCWQYLKEYSLENGEASNFESAHAALATTTRLRPFSGLMPYIIQCWCLHLNRMSTNEDHISQVFWLFWSDQVARARWVETWANCQPTSRQEVPPSVLTSAFAFGAFFGLSNIVLSLAEKCEFGNSSPEEGLKLALEAGHSDIAKALLPSIKSRERCKDALEECCRNGDVQFLEWMLTAPEVAEFSPSQSELVENLAIATREGHSLIIRCLVNAGAKLNTEIEEEKFFAMAITNGYEGALSELIASDAQWMLDSSPTEEADSTVSKSESLLHAAAELGSAAVIEVMADRSEINAQWGEWKATALHSTTPRKSS